MIVIFSVFMALWMAKINKYSAYFQWKVKSTMSWDRIKPFDCVACLSFWTSLITCYAYNLSWDLYVLNSVSAYGAGSFVEKVWYRL